MPAPLHGRRASEPVQRTVEDLRKLRVATGAQGAEIAERPVEDRVVEKDERAEGLPLRRRVDVPVGGEVVRNAATSA